MSENGALQLAIVGYPVRHSLSPLLWQGVGSRRGLHVDYTSIEIEPGDEEGWLGVWQSDLRAFNVTAPYKEHAVEMCLDLDRSAADIGAVNTVVRGVRGWTGYSTDGYGLVRALDCSGERFPGREVMVLGAGGAGRAVAAALQVAGARVTIVTRTPAEVARGCEGCPQISWRRFAEAGPFDIVVNATPLGRESNLSPPDLTAGTFARDALFVDLNYVPSFTAFMESARDAGARVVNGLGMLVHQASLGAALVFYDDQGAAESLEEDFWAVARSLC